MFALVTGMPSPGKGPGKGGGVSPLLTKIQLGPDTYTIGWSHLLTSTTFSDWENMKIEKD